MAWQKKIGNEPKTQEEFDESLTSATGSAEQDAWHSTTDGSALSSSWVVSEVSPFTAAFQALQNRAESQTGVQAKLRAQSALSFQSGVVPDIVPGGKPAPTAEPGPPNLREQLTYESVPGNLSTRMSVETSRPEHAFANQRKTSQGTPRHIPAKLQALGPSVEQLNIIGRTHPREPPKKRSVNEAASSIQRQETCDADIASLGPSPKQKHKGPSPEQLAEELLSSRAAGRIRSHAVARNQGLATYPKAGDKQGDSHEQSMKSRFSRLMDLTRRVDEVERIIITARSHLHLDKEAPDPHLPANIIDQVSPSLRRGRTLAALRKWLTLTRKFVSLRDYLPFMPFDSQGSATFQDYERLTNDDAQELRNILDKSPRAQTLAKAGRAFRECILQREMFPWENISHECLANLHDTPLLHLLTHRYKDGRKPVQPDSTSEQCDLCEGRPCKRFSYSQDISFEQPTSPVQEYNDGDPASSPITSAQDSSEIETGLYQPWPSRKLPLAYSPRQTVNQRPYAALKASNDVLAVRSQKDKYHAFWQEKPQLQLTVPRVVSDKADSITFAMTGNIDGLKQLFSRGLASPRDISQSRRFSLLRWALYGGQSGMHDYQIVQFLLGQGADVDDESFEIVGYYNLSMKYSDRDKKALRCLTSRDRDWVSEQKFPLIHKIVCGLSPKLLRDELSKDPNAIYATDIKGRTALDWATARAQLDHMKLLIAFGANPNSMDITGRTTILHAVDSRNAETLRIVLAAGANPEPQIPAGLFRGNPLTSANLNGLASMVDLLIRFGANLESVNPEGLTALHSTAISQNRDCASILLARGADMDRMTSTGCTPLMTAIIHNSHDVLRLFLAKRTDCLNGSQLLPVIAEYADSETMMILASHPFSPLNNGCLPADCAILFSRSGYDDLLSHAFDRLIYAERCKDCNPPQLTTTMFTISGPEEEWADLLA